MDRNYLHISRQSQNKRQRSAFATRKQYRKRKPTWGNPKEVCGFDVKKGGNNKYCRCLPVQLAYQSKWGPYTHNEEVIDR